LTCRYGKTEVVHGVDVTVAAGEILAIVGESGSGKSTLLRAIAGLHAGQTGRLLLGEDELEPVVRDRSRAQRRALQLVYQNPATSLNPRQPVGRIVARALEAFFPERGARDREQRVGELLDAVQLSRTTLRALPSQLSGGQQQRVALARALAAEPEVLLCDEVVSALDVSVQATVLALIAELRDRMGVSVVFVTHDLAVVRSFADRVVVMRAGVVVEDAPTPDLFAAPETPYARDLLTAAGRGA
jgi:peptide/nickel transport system ATP-binding protein